ncbi:hypothetical protein LCGC14_2135090 [marine sediment metagenome]|uniref:UDP-glucose/GDP-mannose dehydrogenase dimerisation domain-containing protein n=1 Tax=marine sediment metagenome TaxID=412755 RepID=A0A0F9E083_9ZZZZ
MKIGVAGYGFVGQAVHSGMKDEHCHVIYDPPKGYDTLSGLLQCDIIFCCLPTPTEPINSTDGMQSFGYYEKFFKEIGEYRGMLVIKSTVLYCYLEPYLSTFDIVYNPEFLNQNNFQKDFYTQKVIVLGGEVILCKQVEKMYRDCFVFENTPDFEYCSVKEAEELKYVHNVYHAYKVLFWNYVHETCGNQRKIFDMYSRITGNKNEMARVFADGKAGYGGACFPKDVGAFHQERPHDLTKFMMAYNKKIRFKK